MLGDTSTTNTSDAGMPTVLPTAEAAEAASAALAVHAGSVPLHLDLLDVLRILAHEEGRAVPAYTHARITVAPHALVVPAIALANEDATIHAAALSGVGREAPWRILAVADPREREATDEMFGVLDAYLERYLVACEHAERAPQLVVTSVGALRHLTNIADDLRFLERERAVARFATNLAYFTDRAAVPGQQAVVVLTQVLATHWITPLTPSQEGHLGALLATLDPAPGQDLATLVRTAESLTMGPRTAPTFDNGWLKPRLERYTRVRHRGAPPEALQAMRQEIADGLTPIVLRMHRAMQYGLRKLTEAALPPLPEVAAWRADEQEAFTRFRAARAAGVHMPRRDRAKGAAFRLVEREEGQATLDASVQCHDALGRARAAAAGEILVGEIESVRRDVLPGALRRVTAVEVVTDQRALRMRQRDELTWVEDPRLEVVVADVREAGARLRVTLHVTRGMQRPGVPRIGTRLTLVRRMPQPERVQRVRSAMARKLATLPWTHDTAAPLPTPRPRRVVLPEGCAPAAPGAHDPLAALEVLR